MVSVQVKHDGEKSSGLGYDCCCCYPLDSPVENKNKQQIEGNVEQGGKPQKIEGGFRITQSAHDRAGALKAKEKDKANGINVEITDCLRQHIHGQINNLKNAF
jgi:hypothetical protein